jgi:DNA-binding GntR family transcriptional regulator
VTTSDAERGRSGDAAERAYQEIRRNISVGEFGPGARLTEASLSETLAMSRTPVRAALVRLDAEGFVRLTPKRGAVVAAETTIDAEEFLRVREALESQAARVAAGVRDDDEVAQLTATVDRMERALGPDGDAAEVAQLNREFHLGIAGMSRRPRLAAVIAGLYEMPLLRDDRHLEEERARIVVAQHREVVVALEQGDAEWSEAAMRSHLRSAQRTLLAGRSDERRD